MFKKYGHFRQTELNGTWNNAIDVKVDNLKGDILKCKIRFNGKIYIPEGVTGKFLEIKKVL
jgi:hypothetical protein